MRLFCSFVAVVLFSTSVFADSSFYPINKHGDQWIISLGDKLLRHKDFTVAIKALYEKEKKDAFFIDGPLADKVLKHLKVESFEYVLFGQNQVNTLDLENVEALYVVINPAGGFGNGTLGIPINKPNIESKIRYSLGLAKAKGETSFFSGFSMHERTWVEDDSDVASGPLKTRIAQLKEKAKKQKNYPSFEIAKESKTKATFADISIHLATAELKEESGHTEPYFQIALSRGNKTIKQIENQYSYAKVPKRIWMGLLNREQEAIMISPTGMGSCGSLITINEKGNLKEHELPCGTWGC